MRIIRKKKCKLLVIGEAWGVEEEKRKLPFIGPTGKQLREWSLSCGLDLSSPHVKMTNVFNLRPPFGGGVKALCGPKTEGIPHVKQLLKNSNGYVRAIYKAEIDRCWEEIIRHDPHCILALGATPLWLLKTGRSSISKERGYVFNSIKHPDAPRTYKVMPSFHPAYIARSWQDRVYLLRDLHKTIREKEFPEIRYTPRELWINPTTTDLDEFERKFLTPAPAVISADIETGKGHITEVSLAPNPNVAISIPFIKREGSEDGNYWQTLEEEVYAVKWFLRQLDAADRVLGQNFSYDFKWIWEHWLHGVSNYYEDTMVLSHALEPELRKSLEILGSTHANEGYWKDMRNEANKPET